jgi:hypothetical protein
MPALIPALIIGAGTVAGAAISGSAADSAAHTAGATAAQNDALQSQIYGSNKALAQPYVDAGDRAETALNGFLGLGGDPAATQKAFNDYLDSTGYQFNLDQGLGAVSQSKAAAGLLGSGSTLKALDAYGTGLADQYGQQYVGNLQNEVSTGQNAVNGLTGAGQSYANAVSSNNNAAAATAANAGLAGASNTNALIGNALSAYGALRGQTSFGVGAGDSNAFNQPGYAAFGG